MARQAQPGQIVILNGVPRSGKSSIAAAIQARADGDWLNLGVDAMNASITPPALMPGIGLRPGAGSDHLDLERKLPALYAALYESVAACSRLGWNVVVDVGHHDHYVEPRGILVDCAQRLRGLPVLFVGLRCPIEVIMERRNAGQPGREGRYATGTAEDPFPLPVRQWQAAVHDPGIYDLEIDTSQHSPEEGAARIEAWLASGRPASAFDQLAAMADGPD